MAAAERRRGPGPLAGRRIVVTRAPEQAEELIRLLQDAGAEPVLLPMVRFLDPAADDIVALDRAIGALEGFDWLIFTSANAVAFFLKRCAAPGGGPGRGRPRIAAVGAATEAALRAHGVRAAFVPREAAGAALAAELGPELRGRRVLLPRSDRATDDLPRALRAAGAEVTEVTAYRTAAPESSDAAVVEQIRRGAVDAITLFSPSALRQLTQTVGRDPLRGAGGRVAFAAVGPVTAAAIRGAGLPVAVEAETASAAALVAALERHFRDAKEKVRTP